VVGTATAKSTAADGSSGGGGAAPASAGDGAGSGARDVTRGEVRSSLAALESAALHARDAGDLSSVAGPLLRRHKLRDIERVIAGQQDEMPLSRRLVLAGRYLDFGYGPPLTTAEAAAPGSAGRKRRVGCGYMYRGPLAAVHIEDLTAAAVVHHSVTAASVTVGNVRVEDLTTPPIAPRTATKVTASPTTADAAAPAPAGEPSAKGRPSSPHRPTGGESWEGAAFVTNAVIVSKVVARDADSSEARGGGGEQGSSAPGGGAGGASPTAYTMSDVVELRQRTERVTGACGGWEAPAAGTPAVDSVVSAERSSALDAHRHDALLLLDVALSPSLPCGVEVRLALQGPRIVVVMPFIDAVAAYFGSGPLTELAAAHPAPESATRSRLLSRRR
jgi:hypothetical protein